MQLSYHPHAVGDGLNAHGHIASLFGCASCHSLNLCFVLLRLVTAWMPVVILPYCLVALVVIPWPRHICFQAPS